MSKDSNFISEIGKFFKEGNADKAMHTIMDIAKHIRFDEKRLFGTESRYNCKYTHLQVFCLLLMFPCFMVKNAYGYATSSLSGLVSCGKDVFYRFLEKDSTDWRSVLVKVTKRLTAMIEVRRDHREGRPVCLMVDDTDFPKTGLHTEKIGKVFSHVKLGMILGFKALFLGLTDGKSQLILDMAVVGEEGKAKKHGLTKEQLENRFSKDRDEGCPAKTREEEYTKSKITLMIEMVRRAIANGVRFDYILADSWFACSEVIHFVKSRHVRCHYLGMIKVGKKGTTKYLFEGQSITAPAIVTELLHQKRQKYSRRLRCHYMTADVMFDDVPVRLFFVKRVKNGSWNGLVTTDRTIDFMSAYKIYSMRWSIEVVFKDCKELLGLGKYNVRNFTSQIACTTITAIQYNILSVARRFSDYETIGGLFRDCIDDSLELSVTERLWQALLDLVAEIADIFGIDDNNIFDILVNKSDQLNHFVNFYKLKLAS